MSSDIKEYKVKEYDNAKKVMYFDKEILKTSENLLNDREIINVKTFFSSIKSNNLSKFPKILYSITINTIS